MSELDLSPDDCSVARLTDADLPELQSLLERCSDYVELVSGAPAGPAEAAEALASLPPGKQAGDKLCLGIYRGERKLIGFLDLVRDHPAEGEWWLGLLMLDPEERAGGLGGRLYRAAAEWIRGQAGRTVWIGVLEENPGAERFWRRQGFVEVRRQPFAADNGKAHTMIVLRHELHTREAT